MFCVCHHISASFIPYFKVRDEMLQSWDSTNLLIFFQLLHNIFTGLKVTLVHSMSFK
jgi:hypothetical protein